jgi:hypothetical protein
MTIALLSRLADTVDAAVRGDVAGDQNGDHGNGFYGNGFREGDDDVVAQQLFEFLRSHVSEPEQQRTASQDRFQDQILAELDAKEDELIDTKRRSQLERRRTTTVSQDHFQDQILLELDAMEDKLRAREQVSGVVDRKFD